MVNDYGQHGRVYDLTRAATVTLNLDGGDYHSGTVPFSAVVAVHDGQTVLVHRTAWNRLATSDPATGALLATGEEVPHYFHGRLTVSAQGRWIADDGWVWHPVGVPMLWDRRLSGRTLTQRDYYWDNAMCFIGEHAIAVGGIGDDDLWILPGARLFSTESGLELTAFAGPDGDFYSDGHRLYSTHPGGLHAWDPVTGHRTATIPGFRPTHHHRGAGELAELAGGHLRRWLLP